MRLCVGTERRYLHLPVVDGDDTSAGLVDVLLLMEGASVRERSVVFPR